MIPTQRVQILHDQPVSRGKYVLYWMQASQRTRFNHALEYAIEQANQTRLPLIVCFGLMDDYPEANARHYAFMLEGLADVARELQKRKIRFVVDRGGPPAVALRYAKEAAMVVCDRGYLRHQRRWRDKVADDARCRVVQVESDSIVPVELTSDKHEFAARTIRPRIHRQLKSFLKPLRATRVKHSSLHLRIHGDIDAGSPLEALAKLNVDRSVGPSPVLRGGETEARRRLRKFIQSQLKDYSEARNEPAAAHTSVMSAYLHFGQISPLEIALAVQDADAPQGDREAYLEELIVRRELSINFVYYNAKYDSYECLPDWAQKALAQHARDKRPVIYSRQQLERAQTHDPFWNAAQREMLLTGFMHNYMRMYWGKKILEWSRSPQVAFETTLYLNNKYFIDGRDPNAYANVAWIFGLHDRPWGPARQVFGTVRYMNAAGLERKFDMSAYVERIDRLAANRKDVGNIT
jgi:deoxyribodipyrimidine photo-lyase